MGVRAPGGRYKTNNESCSGQSLTTKGIVYLTLMARCHVLESSEVMSSGDRYPETQAS